MLVIFDHGTPAPIRPFLEGHLVKRTQDMGWDQLTNGELLAVAEEITKLLAICVRCGNPAVHTQRLVESEELVVVGAMGMYEARCRRCLPI